MRTVARVAAVTSLAVGAAMLAPVGATEAATKWTKFSTNTADPAGSPGLFRTADGKLHVVWYVHNPNTGKNSYQYATFAAHGALLNKGNVAPVTGWSALSKYPRLVAFPGVGIRLVFAGGTGTGGNYDQGTAYSAKASAAGTSWSLVPGSLSHSKLVSLTDNSAATKSDGTPVASWQQGNLLYHVGQDTSNTPATAPDGTVNVVTGGVATGTQLARAKDGSIWVAWFTANESDQGYWVDQIQPTQVAKHKAPGSGALSLANNQPFGSVAFTARAGGGLYLAYCVATKAVPCDHVALWKVGATKAKTVPGSGTHNARYVAISSAPGGHLWISWFDSGANKVRVVRTNAAVNAFSKVRSLGLPAKSALFDSLRTEGSRGRLDLVAGVQSSASGLPVFLWHNQQLPALKLTGSPATVSHTKATTVTFRVTDVGDPVAGATVKFLTKSAKTNGSGVAKITVPRGTSVGKHAATATKANFTVARFVVKVT